jgi:hypothetical protein
MAFDKLRAKLAARFAKGINVRGDAIETQWLQQLLSRAKPPSVGSDELIAYYQTSPWLHMVVSRVADAFASVQWRVGYMQRPRGAKVASKCFRPMARGALRKAAAGDGLEFVDLQEHLLLELLYGGNSNLPGNEVRRLMQIYVDLLGESYALKQRNGVGKPVSLWPFPPTWIRRRPNDNDPNYTIRSGSTEISVAPEDVFVVRSPNPANPMSGGVGTSQALGTEIDTDEYASEFSKAFFYNFAQPSQIIGIEGIQKDTAARITAAWKNKYGGPGKAGQTEIVGGKVTATRLSDPLGDADTIAMREFERNTAAQVFGLPPEVLGIIENSNRATIEGADVIMAKYVITPRLERWQGYLQRLAREYDPRLIVTYDDPAPDDKTYRLQAATVAPWALSRGEWRVLAGHDDRGEVDDVHMEPLAIVARRADGQQALAPVMLQSDEARPAAPAADDSVASPDGTTPKEAQTIFGYHLQLGVAKINEARENLNLPPVEYGDQTVPEYLASIGTSAVDAGAEYETEEEDDLSGFGADDADGEQGKARAPQGGASR